MYELRKFVTPEFIFGAGARREAGRYALNFGARQVLVVTDPGVVAAGWAEELMATLEADGIACTCFSDVSPNPRDHEVMAGAEHYRATACDVILAVGGGSVMDCAKGISIIAANGGHILDYVGIDRIPLPGPPLICIPTTAGSAADVSQFAIINAVELKTKVAIISKAIVPDVALVDPETTTTMSAYLTACTGLDALTHAVEAFVSTASSPISDLHALAAIRGVAHNLHRAVNDPFAMGAREEMMLASLHAGIAFSNASLGLTHSMAHSLGGYLDLPHGECNALLLPTVIGFNFPAAVERYRAIGQAFGLVPDGEGALQHQLVEEACALRSSVGIKGGLCQRGFSAGIIDELAERALRDGCIYTNPRRPSLGDLRELYAEAL